MLGGKSKELWEIDAYHLNLFIIYRKGAMLSQHIYIYLYISIYIYIYGLAVQTLAEKQDAQKLERKRKTDIALREIWKE